MCEVVYCEMEAYYNKVLTKYVNWYNIYVSYHDNLIINDN